jgi:hypothetical protein
MRYSLMLRSRANPNQSIEEKHAQFMSGLLEMTNAWAPITRDLPNAPDPGANLCVGINLLRYFGKGIRGEVLYQYRGQHLLKDAGVCDDFFTLKFNPEKVDYESLVKEAVAQYIKAFRPYVAYIENEEIILIDIEERRQTSTRHQVYKIRPMHFMDRELCRRAFNCSPEQVVDILKDHVEKVDIVLDGVLIIASSKVLSLEEADEVNTKLKPLLVSS